MITTNLKFVTVIKFLSERDFFIVIMIAIIMITTALDSLNLFSHGTLRLDLKS